MVAKKLGVPATETHKALEGLRSRGYRIEARGKGFRLTGFPERLGEYELEPLLQTRELGRALRYFDETTSTSEIAWRAAEEGAPHGLVVIADQQTRGRGRHGRTWLSPPGVNLYLSLVLRPDVPPARAPELTLLAAVALCEAIRDTGCERARIKWPNDVEIGAHKAAGVLTELSADERGVSFVVVGIGLDVNMGAEDLPEEIKTVATSVRIALGKPYPRARLLARLLERFETWLDRWEDEGFGAVRARWTALSSTVGSRVRLMLDGRQLEGRAEGIDEAGHLVVRTEQGGLEHVVAGDVKTLRAAD
ncbi:MAG: biotin--[acetyl-CoA-carboxylase] ligase [Deltaproteobacteria bacterium]|nr:biotin--[acetyl-CoA-carboxylase] ligase [Deltaproteobacteria bacterium]